MRRFGKPHSIALACLVGLLTVDAFFAGAFLIRALSEGGGVFADESWALWKEGGYGEWWGYAKLIAAAAVLAVTWKRTGASMYLSWAIVWSLVAADDIFTLHERAGRLFEARGISFSDVLGAQNSGELAAWGALGAIVGLLLISAYTRRTGNRGHFLRFGQLLALLVFFAAGLDMLRDLLLQLFGESSLLVRAVHAMEDGGELLTMSFVLAYSIFVLIHASTATTCHGGPAD